MASATSSIPESTLYEFTDGARLREEWRDQSVPVPPQDIRARLRLPAKYTLASLAPEVQAPFDPALLRVALQYRANWPAFRARGLGPVLAGPARVGASYTAAAIANEIVTRSVARSLADIQVSWLSCFYVLQMIQDARHLTRFDTYTALRDAMLTNDLIVVDDLTAAEHITGGVPFMHMLYARRHDHNLPTITTVTVPQGRTWKTEVQRVFGRNFIDRLQGTTEGLVAVGTAR